MGKITSGTGLISGMDIQNIVKQLISIEQRPIDLLKTRIDNLSKVQTEATTLQAKLLAIQVGAANFNKQAVFQKKTVSTSNEDVMTATATNFAINGTHRFTVKQLATANQLISGSYSRRDQGMGVGKISFEVGQGQVGRPTSVGFINGQKGFQRGKISITDRAGNTAEIDLRMAMNMRDVVDAISNQSGIKVTAYMEGNSLVVKDDSGGTQNLKIQEVGAGSHTAADLGIKDDVAANQINGSQINYISQQTLLSDLNDGNGVRGLGYLHNKGGILNDIKFTTADGTELTVDLNSQMKDVSGDTSKGTTLRSINSGSGVRAGTFRITDQNRQSIDITLDQAFIDTNTMAALKEKIQTEAAAKGMNITFNFSSMDHVTVQDGSKGTTGQDRLSHFTIQDLSGSAANDLGIVGDVAGATVTGQKIWHMETLGDVMSAVNNHWENDGSIVVSIDKDNNSLKVTDNSGLSGNLKIEDLGYGTAEDLGLITSATDTGTVKEGRRLIAGMNTVLLRSLNGGNGNEAGRITQGGAITVTDVNNAAQTIDLSEATSLQDVIKGINNAGLAVKASLNAVGNGITLTGVQSVVDANGGDLAAKLHLTGSAANNTIDSGNLQLQYVSGATSLDSLRQGQGIRRGQFKITDAYGASATINLAQDKIKTLDDVIDEINLASVSIDAQINSTGDGILLKQAPLPSQAPGTLAIKVEAVNGASTAADLGILGAAKSTAAVDNYIDGSYEFALDVGGGDSLDDIASQINKANKGFKASVVGDGSSYYLSFSSDVSGRKGQIYADGGATSLTVNTMREGKDAVIFLGDESSHPFVISNNTNTIDGAVKGVKLELKSVSDTPVEISITQDLDGIKKQISSFVDAYNAAMDEIDTAIKFDPNTLEKGLLFSEQSAYTARDTLSSMINRSVPGAQNTLRSLSQVGITFAPLGAQSQDKDGTTYAAARSPRLQFDEATFDAAYAKDPDGVATLFTKKDVGIGDYINTRLDQLAGTTESVFKNSVAQMDDQKKMLNDRITSLSELLSRKETRLYKQFYAMEQALAKMQSQQSALSQLSSVAAASKTNK